MKKILICVLSCTLLFFGCSKIEKPKENIATKDKINNVFLIDFGKPKLTFKGSGEYTIVNSKGLKENFDRMEKVMFFLGMVKYDKKFDCNFFASLYISVAQITYLVETWHFGSNADGLALAEIWYKPDNSKNRHAIVAVLTEIGLIFIEPQTGKRIFLTDTEKDSIFFIKW